MKRSEALHLIQDVLNLKGGPLAILNALEQAGMLPPSTKLEHISTEDNAWEPETCPSCKVPCGNDWCCTKDVK